MTKDEVRELRKPSEPPPPEETADLFDYALIRDYVTYVLGSMRRHKLLLVATFAACVGMAVVALKVMPKTYHVETTVLAQRNQLIAALGNPSRPSFEQDAPTRAAAEIITSRANLLALAQQTNAAQEWQRTRAPILRLKDLVMKLLRQPETDEERLNEIVGLLDKRLRVVTGGEGTVTISIEWPDAVTAYRLADAAERNFLEARHLAESNSISEAISLLEGHALLLHERVEQAAAELRPASEAAKSKAVVRVVHAEAVQKTPSEDPEVARLKVMLEAKRREIKDLEDFRARQLADLQGKMTEQRAIYSPAHPIIIDLQERIDAVEKQESPQLAGLRQDEEDLVKQLQKRGVTSAQAEAATSARAMAGDIQRLEREAAKNDDPALDNLRGELRFALNKYASILDRIDNARMELDAARAAFKYRYMVVRPAEVPKSPRKPNAAMILAMSAVLGVVAAVLLVTIVDLRRGLVLQRWQLERRLSLPVLAHMTVEP